MSEFDDLMKKTVLTVVQEFAVAGAMMSDKEWEETRDAFTAAFASGMDETRGNVRMKIMQSMFRTDEEE